MKMTEEQIVDLIVKVGRPIEQAPPGTHLINHYAAVLSDVSEKLTKDELAELIALGAKFYQLGVYIWKQGIDEENLCTNLRKVRGK